jgi:hypothetical protein
VKKGMMTDPWLQPFRTELGVDSRLEYGRLRFELYHQNHPAAKLHDTYQGKETGRVTHTVDINQVLVSPILTEWDCIGESVLFSHTITSSWVLGTSDCLGKSDIHNIFIELSNGNRGRDEVICSWWLGKDNSLVGITMVGRHLDKSAISKSSKSWGGGLTGDAGTERGNREDYFLHR